MHIWKDVTGLRSPADLTNEAGKHVYDIEFLSDYPTKRHKILQKIAFYRKTHLLCSRQFYD